MILVTGASGLLGSTLVPQFKLAGRTAITHAYCADADYLADLTNASETFSLLDKIQPSVIVNLVGLTSVEQCQEQPNRAYLLNTKTVENLVLWILRTKFQCHLIQISTDQVYDGKGEHLEEEITLTNNYAFSKYAGELAAARVPSTILRTNFIGRSKVHNRVSLTDWVFSSLTGKKQVQVLDDVYFSPLSMVTLSRMIQVVIEKKPVGVFNLGTHEGMSKADFDYAFAEILGLPIDSMTRINSSQATFLKAYRPKDMRMDCSKFEQVLGVKLPLLRDEITNVAREYHEES